MSNRPNEPLQRVFSPDNLLWTIVAKGVDIVGLSLVWAFLCIPVVTIGPATSALYYTVVKCVRQKEKGTFGVYFKSFRSCLKKGILATLIILPIALMIAVGFGIMKANRESSAGAVMFVAYYIALVIPAGIVCWLFPLMGRFESKLTDAFKTSAQLALRHLPSTVVVVLLAAETVIFLLEKWWPVFFAPAVAALLASLFFERIFPKYLTEEDKKLLTLTSETPTEDDE